MAKKKDGLNKTEVTRQAFRELGIDTPLAKLNAHLQEKHGIVAPANVSVIRKQLRDGGKKEANGSTKVAKANGVAPRMPTPEAAQRSHGMVYNLRHYIDWCGGKEALKEVIDLL